MTRDEFLEMVAPGPCWIPARDVHVYPARTVRLVKNRQKRGLVFTVEGGGAQPDHRACIRVRFDGDDRFRWCSKNDLEVMVETTP